MKGLLLLYLSLHFIYASLEEVEIKKLVTLSKDKDCLKPIRNDVVTIHYMVKYPNGTTITPFTENKMQMGLIHDMFDYSIQGILFSMCVGEKVEATLPSSYMDPPTSPSIVQLELIDTVERMPLRRFFEVDSNWNERISRVEMIEKVKKEHAFDHEMMRRKGLDAKVEAAHQELENWVDETLQTHDHNGDGYLTLQEYTQSHSEL